jgi:hypothetical protein
MSFTVSIACIREKVRVVFTCATPDKWHWGRGFDATTRNKPSSVLYPIILKRPGSNDDVMGSFAKQIGADFVTLEFSQHAGYPVPILKTCSHQNQMKYTF